MDQLAYDRAAVSQHQGDQAAARKDLHQRCPKAPIVLDDEDAAARIRG
jgi:hypothetical protein